MLLLLLLAPLLAALPTGGGEEGEAGVVHEEAGATVQVPGGPGGGVY